MSHKTAVALSLLFSTSCGGDPPRVEVPPEAICDERFGEDAGWCGGDPTGTWTYASACHRGLLQMLHDACPQGSFVMTPRRVVGELTLTSTSSRGTFGHDPDAPVRVELFEACIQTIGTCPRSYLGMPLNWEGDFATTCVATIPFEVVGSDRGGVVIEGNEIAYALLPDFRNEFCAETSHLYLSPPRNSNFETADYFYILPRSDD
jgi:hypothetical protein